MLWKRRGRDAAEQRAHDPERIGIERAIDAAEDMFQAGAAPRDPQGDVQYRRQQRALNLDRIDLRASCSTAEAIRR